MSLLNALYQHERARSPDGRPVFDLIVVDMPATGHALQTLGVPRGAFGMIRVGTLAERAREIDLLLHDTARTAIAIVTLPQELPVNEAVQLVERLATHIGIAAELVVINRVLPELFDPAERELLDRLSGSAELGPGQALIDAVAPSEDQRQLQLKRIIHLKARVSARFVEVRQFPSHGAVLVNAFAAAVAGAV
jgi:anion-transporting  ArsA/GET3 family ATPase